MRVVFRRYETTLALPIEYGTVNVVAVFSGLIFFDETSTMDTWQIAVVLASLVVIVCGLFLGQADSLFLRPAGDTTPLEAPADSPCAAAKTAASSVEAAAPMSEVCVQTVSRTARSNGAAPAAASADEVKPGPKVIGAKGRLPREALKV
jgi:hypothetical protein